MSLAMKLAKYAVFGTAVCVAFVAYRVRQQLKANEVRYQVNTKGVVLLTGASSGIGQHASIYLATKFPNLLILAGVRKEADAAAVRDLDLPNLQPITIDVANQSSCIAAFAEVRSICSTKSLLFVGLINNAGVARRYPTEFHDATDARAVFDTNFWGAFYLTQLFLPLLRESRGRIINISSIAEFTGTPMNSIYVASKTAMGGWSDSLRREISHMGISVSVVQPAYIKSAIFDTAKSAATRLGSNGSNGSATQCEAPKGSTHGAAAAPSVPEEVKTQYTHFFSSAELQRLEAEISADASEPVVVSEAVEHALLDAYPRTRYAVGKVAGIPAWACAWIRWALDDRAVDKLITPVP